MLGDFITRGLVLILGYAYPAFECFKTMEKNRVDIEELRFWCQYWIIAAMLTVFERLGDVFISWLPMYGEMKLALIIYLWYPKTKGSSYVYESLLRPYVSKHETHIDRKLIELRVRAWDLAIFYWQNCTELGQTKFFEIFQFLASQSGKKDEPPSKKQQSGKKRPPVPPPPPTIFNRAISQTPISNLVQVHPDSQTEYLHTEDSSTPDPVTQPGPTAEKLHAARLRLRRSSPHQ